MIYNLKNYFCFNLNLKLELIKKIKIVATDDRIMLN